MKRLTMLVCLWHAACALGSELVTVTTNSFGVCRQLEDGKIYRFAESMDFTAVSTEYGPEICGADGTVTFKNVRRPAERQGFFTIWSN